MGDKEFTKWRSVTVPELKAFLGFHILMGINHLPSLDDYWRRDPLLHYTPIAGRITRDRFREVSRYLHFVNDSLQPRESPGYDRLGKVRPVINHLSTKFADLYQPHCEVAIDEAMIKFQGRSSLKQYNPMKPIKRGIKVGCWQIATTATLLSSRCTPERKAAGWSMGLARGWRRHFRLNCRGNTTTLSLIISSPARR